MFKTWDLGKRPAIERIDLPGGVLLILPQPKYYRRKIGSFRVVLDVCVPHKN